MAAMSVATHSPLANIEPRLRSLLPADLYAQAWVDPSPATLIKVFEHLRTLQRILYDHTPRQLSDDPPRPGQVRHGWQESTLMFTDLAGFTPLVEANASRGKEGGAFCRYSAPILPRCWKLSANRAATCWSLRRCDG
jgi:hypothetical protein